MSELTVHVCFSDGHCVQVDCVPPELARRLIDRAFWKHGEFVRRTGQPLVSDVLVYDEQIGLLWSSASGQVIDHGAQA